MDDAVLSNIPEYTVSEVSGAVKRTLEGAFGRIRVRGEITELKRYPSGHIYLSLKDAGGKIAGVVWKSVVPRLGLAPENGVEVVAQGRISSYGDRSTYQLVIERMDYAGAGALLARIEALRLRLAAEGLFDAGRKRPLPPLPGVIGIVTSESGAVIEDIRTTIARRFPRHLLLWPVPVQGDGAAARIAAAIAGFDALPASGAIPRPDVLIVARGGGSLEDLMAFNEEPVLRAAAACRIPLISAVGHETDTTLLDHVADRRAPTPTAAAELAVPMRSELVADLLHKSARIAGGFNRLLNERTLLLHRAERGLPDLPSLLGAARQRLDDRAHRLGLALPGRMALAERALERIGSGLAPLQKLVATAGRSLTEGGMRLRQAVPNFLAADGGKLSLAGERLRSAIRHAVARPAAEAGRVLPRLQPALMQARLREARATLEGAAARLGSVSPDAVLARGYALVTDAAGRPVVAAARVRPGAALDVRFGDGSVAVTARRKPEEKQPQLQF